MDIFMKNADSEELIIYSAVSTVASLWVDELRICWCLLGKKRPNSTPVGWCSELNIFHVFAFNKTMCLYWHTKIQKTHPSKYHWLPLQPWQFQLPQKTYLGTQASANSVHCGDIWPCSSSLRLLKGIPWPFVLGAQ